jgi:hypothetical protein
MKNKFLLDTKLQKYAVLALLTGIGLGIAYLNNSIIPILQKNKQASGLGTLLERSNYQGDLALTLMLIGLFIIGFTKHKQEDEYIDFLRYQALLKTAFFQTATIILGTWLFGGINFLNIMLLNLFSFLVLFILIFRISLYLVKKNTPA